MRALVLLLSLALVLPACGPKKPSAATIAASPAAVATAAVAATPAAPKAITLPPSHEETLANGLTVLVIEDRELPVVAMTMLFTNGSEADPADKAGLTELTAAVLRQGTAKRSGNQIAEEIDFIGGDLSGGADADSAQVSVQVLAKDFAKGLDLLSDVVLHPTFPKSEIEDLKRQTLASVKLVYDDPSELGRQHIRALVLGEGHPYAAYPSERSISSISQDDLRKHWGTWFRPNRAILAIAGDVKKDDVIAAVKSAFEGWERGPAVEVKFPEVPPAKRVVRLVDKPDLTQSSIRIALPGIDRKSPDYHAAILMNYVLGGGAFSSRLIKVVRSDEGKTYGIGSGFTIQKRPALFGISTSTRNAETVATLDLVFRELELMRETGMGVTPQELAAAKSNLIGKYPMGFETANEVVMKILGARLLGLPISEITDYRQRIAAVSLDEVNAAARKYLDSERATIVVVGKAADVKAPLEAKYGEIEVVDFLVPPRAVDRVKPRGVRRDSRDRGPGRSPVQRDGTR